MCKFAALFSIVATLFPWSPSLAAPPEGPASSVSVYAGGAFMSEYFDQCGDYSDYCDGYDRSNTYSGPEFGVDARIVMQSGFLIDLSAEHARVSDSGDAFLEQQATAGLGYEGHIGRRASWYAEGLYQYYRLGENFMGCGYSCNGWYKGNGGGVKGGFTWPFANRFFGTFDLRVSYLSGKDGNVDLVQGKLDGSVGYMLTDYFSVALGAGSQAIQQSNSRGYAGDYNSYYNHSDETLSHVSVFLKLAAHF